MSEKDTATCERQRMSAMSATGSSISCTRTAKWKVRETTYGYTAAVCTHLSQLSGWEPLGEAVQAFNEWRNGEWRQELAKKQKREAKAAARRRAKLTR